MCFYFYVAFCFILLFSLFMAFILLLLNNGFFLHSSILICIVLPIFPAWLLVRQCFIKPILVTNILQKDYSIAVCWGSLLCISSVGFVTACLKIHINICVCLSLYMWVHIHMCSCMGAKIRRHPHLPYLGTSFFSFWTGPFNGLELTS